MSRVRTQNRRSTVLIGVGVGYGKWDSVDLQCRPSAVDCKLTPSYKPRALSRVCRAYSHDFPYSVFPAFSVSHFQRPLSTSPARRWEWGEPRNPRNSRVVKVFRYTSTGGQVAPVFFLVFHLQSDQFDFVDGPTHQKQKVNLHQWFLSTMQNWVECIFS